MKFKYSNILLFVARLSLPLLVICSIYFSDYYTFSIDRMSPSSEILNNLKTVPATDVLNEVAAVTLGVSPAISRSQRNSIANALLEGKLVTPRPQPASVPLVGWPDDLLHGDPSFQLVLASLDFENLLLDEFEYSGDRRYYLAARDRILAFANWEEQQRKPIAFLWNDHAIAARIAVIVRFWRHLRRDADTTDRQKASLIELVMRSGELLAKQKLFTVRTNHGVMQNIALLQVTAAFPLLPKTKDWRNLAIERLELQLGFYVSDEGVVLEHSAGYHLLGTKLLAQAATLIRLNGMAPSERLLKAIQNTEKFSRMLLRPDGTLPAFGNTDAGSHESLAIIRNNGMGILRELAAPFSQPPEMTVLFPISGYALWWSQLPVSAQTVVAWSNHRLHGHKHADEPSIHMWSRGYNWITATGYWPYGHEGFDEANGWAGSNAPHALKESASSPRQIRLLGVGNDGPLRVADIEVCRDSRMCVRRQVLQLSAEQLLVVDNISNSDAGTEILWTTDPRLSLRQINKQSFESNETEMGHRLHIELTSTTNQEITLLIGSVTPFAGWVVSSGTPQPSYAIRAVCQGRDVAMATLIEVTESPNILSFQSFTRKDNEDWRISLRRQGGEVIVERKGRNLSVIQPNATVSIRVNEPPDIAIQQIVLRSAMDEAVDRYPPWRDLSEYHSRLILIVVLLWLVTEVGIIANATHMRKRPWLQFAPTGGWVVLALWIHYWYLI
jgi:hypothetical protein